MQQYNKKFKALVNSKVIKNYMSSEIVKRLGILYKQKEYLYPLVIILGDLIFYKNEVIYIKTEPVDLRIKR